MIILSTNLEIEVYYKSSWNQNQSVITYALVLESQTNIYQINIIWQWYSKQREGSMQMFYTIFENLMFFQYEYINILISQYIKKCGALEICHFYYKIGHKEIFLLYVCIYTNINIKLTWYLIIVLSILNWHDWFSRISTIN